MNSRKIVNTNEIHQLEKKLATQVISHHRNIIQFILWFSLSRGHLHVNLKFKLKCLLFYNLSESQIVPYQVHLERAFP